MSKELLGIIQPGKIGDIIICLPIARWYYDKGYEIIWPIDRNIIANFIGYVNYVNFIPIDFNCMIANQVCYDAKCSKILDIAFTIPGASSENSNNYLTQTKYSFDEYKYFLAGVPFEEKWKLSIQRNIEREKQFIKFWNLKSPYVIIQENSSDYVRKVDWCNKELQRVDLVSASNSIFDWIGVLEKAEQHILIESCFTNLIDQLNIKVPKQILLTKNGYYGNPLEDGRLRGEPVLHLPWIKK